MDELCIRPSNRVALIEQGRETTFRELAEEASGVAVEDFPILCEPNSRALVVKLVALLASGRPFALLHPRLTQHERDEQIAVLQAHEPPEGTAAILFTSGSSGRAKAACLPRRAFVASARATRAHLGPALDRWQLALPLCHVGGLSILTRALVLDTAIVLDGGEATGTSLVPTQLRRLLRDTTGPLDRLVVLGGAAAPAPLLAEAAARGLRVLCTYGMTETCSMVTLERPGATERSSGVALGENRVEIRDGGVWLSGPSLFSGYLGHPPATQPFDTGDLGWLAADGALHVESRRSDLIVTGGENVYPLEVERVLLGSELVTEIVVYGAPSDEWGQEVRAAVVGDPAQAAALEAYARAALAPHKRPKRFTFLAELPLLPSGKVHRSAVATLADSGALKRDP